MLSFVIIPLFASYLAGYYQVNNIRVFEDPENIANSVYYFGLLMIFTAIILLLIKLKAELILQAIILILIVVSVQYVLLPFLPTLISLAIAVFFTAILYKFPKWYTVDCVGVILGIGISAVFGISFTPVPLTILLVALAAYDFISVYKTRHMVTMADIVVRLKVPVILVFPYNLDFEFQDDLGDMKKQGAFFLGLGDIIMPSMLTVSSNTFLGGMDIGFINLTALFVIIGTISGFAALMWFAKKKEGPHPGLPFLISGALIGLGLGILLNTF